MKDGLSVVVTIPIQSRSNVLQVPNRALTRQGQTTTVQRLQGTLIQTVTVQTGLTDNTNTEIISGLNQGDQVLLKSVVAATANPGGGGGFFGP